MLRFNINFDGWKRFVLDQLLPGHAGVRQDVHVSLHVGEGVVFVGVAVGSRKEHPRLA